MKSVLQAQRIVQRKLRSLILAVTVLASLGLATPAVRTAAAHLPAQAGSAACRINGTLVAPKVDAAHPYGWAFAANFDHATGNPITCLVTQQWPNAPTYDVGQHCKVINNIGVPSTTFGNKLARFDGNAYLACQILVQATMPEIFYLHARASLTGSSTATPLNYTFLSSNVVSVTGQVNGCTLTLSSRYNTFNYSNSTGTVCGSFVEIGSRMRQNMGAQLVPTLTGIHRLGAVEYRTATGIGPVELPMTYTFSIAAPGQRFDLDWLLIDPSPQKTGGS